MNRIRRWLGRVWTLFVAAVLSMRPLTAVVLVGWTYRLMQRETARAWWRQSASPAKGPTFDAFCDAHPDTKDMALRPRWLLATPSTRAMDSERGVTGFRRAIRTLFSGLARNLKLGAQALFNTFVLTLPAGMLWWLGWTSGWNNSFHKGYEQIFLGTTIALLGVVWFCIVMLHIPLAQARQAATGDWRRFYDFRLVARLARVRWRGVVLLAGLYSLLGIVVSLIKVVPQFVGIARPEMAAWTDAELFAWLEGYFFWASIPGVLAYLLLQVIAARVYARAVSDGVRQGVIDADMLAPVERLMLDRLDLTAADSPGKRHVLVQAASTTSRFGIRGMATALTLLLWFSFVAQVFVTEFIAYHGARGWMNQPLVQAPYFRSIPPHLQPETGQTAAAAGTDAPEPDGLPR